MKTVVITGSAKGLGFEMAKEFRRNNYNVVISDVLSDKLHESRRELEEIKSDATILDVICDVTKESDIENLMEEAIKKYGSVDIWINNAGVNQLMIPIWKLEQKSIDKILDINLKGAITGSKIALKQMIKQGYGQIYGKESYGSNDATMLGLSLYGTSKRGLTYFFNALANEVKEEGLNICVGVLAPGIMITDFLTHSESNISFELSDKTKKVYNILGDYPDVIAHFLVSKMITNKKNNVRINWLTNRKAAFRFMTSAFNKRNFFKGDK